MGTPGELFKNVKNLPRRALLELMSALSSLNMTPDLNPGFSVEAYDPNTATDYISTIDANVSHAVEHIHLVMDILERAERQKTWVLQVIFTGAAEQYRRLYGDLFGVECFHGERYQAEDHFIRYLIDKNLITASMADPAHTAAYGYDSDWHQAVTWLRQFGFDYILSCPQADKEGI